MTDEGSNMIWEYMRLALGTIVGGGYLALSFTEIDMCVKIAVGICTIVFLSAQSVKIIREMLGKK
jgi:hypothetical protein